jgi:hypothetical protein
MYIKRFKIKSDSLLNKYLNIGNSGDIKSKLQKQYISTRKFEMNSDVIFVGTIVWHEREIRNGRVWPIGPENVRTRKMALNFVSNMAYSIKYELMNAD